MNIGLFIRWQFVVWYRPIRASLFFLYIFVVALSVSLAATAQDLSCDSIRQTGDIDMRAASRTEGVAPLSVFFDAVSESSLIEQPSPDQDGYKNYADLVYTWNFGDASAGSYAASGRPKNVASGSVAAHVYESAGTYCAALSVFNPSNGNITRYLQEITITQFSGTRLFVSRDGSDQSSGLTALNPRASLPSRAELEILLQSGPVEVLLRRGDQWNSSIQLLSGIRYGAYANPDGSDNPTSNKPTIRGAAAIASDSSQIVVRDINFQGSGQLFYQTSGVLRDKLFLRTDFSNFSWAFSVTYEDAPHEHFFLVDSTIQDAANYGVWYGGKKSAILGTRIARTNSHNIRLWWTDRFVVSHNHLSDGKTGIKLHNDQAYHDLSNYLPERDDSQHVVISDNTLYDEDSAYYVALAPQDGGGQGTYETRSERVRNILFERNRMTGLNTVLIIRARYVTVRNNIIEAIDRWMETPVIRLLSVDEPPAKDTRIFNNTFLNFTEISGGAFPCIQVGGAITDTKIINNTCAGQDHPSSVVWGTSQGLILQTNLSYQANEVPTEPAIIDSGTFLPSVISDFRGVSASGGIPRPQGDSHDIGAFEMDLGEGGIVDPPAPQCTVDAECDDGLACNGLETCSENGYCVSGTAPCQEDSVGCTSVSCSESGPFGFECRTQYDNSFCDAGSSNTCINAAICIGEAGDSNGCAIDYAPAGTSCADAYSCSVGDQCNGLGECVPGEQLDSLCSNELGCGVALCVAGDGADTQGCSYADCPVDESLVLFTLLNGDATDLSSLIREARASGSIQYGTDQNGRAGAAARFNGSSFLAYPQDSASDTREQLTLSAWVRIEGSPGSGGGRILSSPHPQADWNTDRFALTYDGRFVFRVLTSTGQHDATSSDFNEGEWNHLAGVFDGSTIRLYINGALASQRIATGQIIEGNADFTIGGHLFSADRRFNGLIDEAKHFSQALGALEIEELFLSGVTSPDLGGEDPSPSPEPSQSASPSSSPAASTSPSSSPKPGASIIPRPSSSPLPERSPFPSPSVQPSVTKSPLPGDSPSDREELGVTSTIDSVIELSKLVERTTRDARLKIAKRALRALAKAADALSTLRSSVSGACIETSSRAKSKRLLRIATKQLARGGAHVIRRIKRAGIAAAHPELMTRKTELRRSVLKRRLSPKVTPLCN